MWESPALANGLKTWKAASMSMLDLTGGAEKMERHCWSSCLTRHLRDEPLRTEKRKPGIGWECSWVTESHSLSKASVWLWALEKKGMGAKTMKRTHKDERKYARLLTIKSCDQTIFDKKIS